MFKKLHFSLISLIFLITLISLTANLYFYLHLREENRVVEVVDGDTFQLVSGKRIRLMGVDAPEYDRCGGKEAKEKLTSLILGKTIILKEETKEAYGRSLSLVYQGKNFINEMMLVEGWGRPDYRNNSQRDVLTASYHKARNGKKGIFSGRCQEKDAYDCDIKGNIGQSTYEKFYHLPSCLHYDEVVIDKDRGEQYFCTEQEAVAAGFLKASGCP
jgi:endonuclease YncB( thermonuclease family)